MRLRLLGTGQRPRPVCDARLLGAHDERGLDRGAEVRAVAEGWTRALAQGRATDVSDVEVPVKVLAIDPGSAQSAFVLFDGERVSDHGLLPNAEMLRRIRERLFGGPGNLTVIEQIESFGMAVGRETFETVFWAGRFAQAAGRFGRLPRSTVKLHLCRSRKAKDGNIRQALLDRFGGAAAVGTKHQPGPLRGISSHRWAALAVAVTWWDLQQVQQRKVG